MAVTGLISKYINGIAGLALLIPGLAAGSRRLHDTGKSGWFQLLGLIPFVGALIVLYLMAQPTDPAANGWGSPPTTSLLTPLEAPDQQ